MKRIVQSLVAVAAALALLVPVAACGGDRDVEPPPPGVSFLDYSPKPFYKDMTEMTVRFTTTGPAGGDALSDRGYFVWVFTGKDNRDRTGCWPEFAADRGVPGEAGTTYVQRIQMVVEDPHEEDPAPDAHACTGLAQVVVWTGDNGECCSPMKVMRKLSFRILPPRSQ